MNYFIELNPDYNKENFNVNNAIAVDSKSKALIKNMKIFLINQFKEYNIPFSEHDIDIYYDDYYETYGLEVFKRRVTCDYLGPSTYYVSQKFNNAYILKIIIACRIFGGHMLWPSSLSGIGRFDNNGNEITKSINTARSYCLKERLDYTIFEIREWYINSGDNGTPIFQMVLESNRDWFERFGKGEDGYKKFLNVFILQDFVHPDTLLPYDFESFNERGYDKIIQKKKRYINDYIPSDNKSYKNYINGTINALEKRDKRIKSSSNLYENF